MARARRRGGNRNGPRGDNNVSDNRTPADNHDNNENDEGHGTMVVVDPPTHGGVTVVSRQSDGHLFRMYTFLAASSFLLLINFGMGTFNKWHWILITLVEIILVAFFCCMTDASVWNEKTMLTINVMFICIAAIVVASVTDHPCTQCAIQLPNLIAEHVLPKPGGSVLPGSHAFVPSSHMGHIWHFLVLTDNPVPQTCAICLNQWTHTYKYLAAHNQYNNSVANVLHYVGLDSIAHFAQEDEEIPEPEDIFDDIDNTCFDQELENGVTPSALRQMDAWYTQVQKSTQPKGSGKRLLQAIAIGLGSEVGRELFGNTAQDFLCYPASRMTGPKPSEFLLALQRPRFTGESRHVHEGRYDAPMNITMKSLQHIMREDKLALLGPHVCFLTRLAGLIPEDNTILTDTLSPGNVAPIANEKAMKGIDGSFLYPGLFIPQTDEDKDPDGQQARITAGFLSLYIRLPEKDWDPQFFDTTEEYIAFFRWTVEHRLQEEYYFPKWLSFGHVGGLNSTEEHRQQVARLVEDAGNLVSSQFRFHSDRLRLTNPTTDRTLSDRAFFGTGMKSMTRIKLPSDEDYPFIHPFGPDYFETERHRQFFRTLSKPPEEELLRMGHLFWGKQVPLEEYRNRVVEIDYTAATHWHRRELFEELGAILYLEAESRRVMGIWVSAQDAIIMPTEGRRWEYAKIYFRTTELSVLALRHVAEYHLGWANIFSNAIRQTLPPTHGLRVLIKPYTHGTAAVNWNAYQMLILDRSILDRASGLTRLGRGYTWGHIQKHFEMYKSFPQVLKDKKLDGMANLNETIPLFTQGGKLYAAHHKFVDGLLGVIYHDDEALTKDRDLQRFWHHINTYGRHMDPCVCGMDSDLFHEPDHWPSFEENSNRTCDHLMDFEEFYVEKGSLERRESWCQQHQLERTRVLHQMLKNECRDNPSCPSLSYDFLHMRASFDLPPLSRKVLADVLATFIYEVTAGHELVADNIPYMVDPAYGGVRLLRKDSENKLPLKVDIASYIFGTVIAALTTIRSKPLLSDWSNLLIDWSENQANLKEWSDEEREERSQQVALLHFEYKARLVELSNEFLKETGEREPNKWSPFLIPATQATSIAV